MAFPPAMGIHLAQISLKAFQNKKIGKSWNKLVRKWEIRHLVSNSDSA